MGDRKSRTHVLKTWDGPFEATIRSLKRFEFRRNDRDFQVGDVLDLVRVHPDNVHEFDPEDPGRERYIAVVTYIAHGPSFGIPEGFCVMSIIDGAAVFKRLLERG